MKQGLSLRVSQHLALTPQLQQSIRLLQLSTLELGQEIEQMLDENPFLEVAIDDLPREEFGVPQADTPVQADDLGTEAALGSFADHSPALASDNQGDADSSALSSEEPSWDGDGCMPVAPDDSEWGGDALPHGNDLSTDDDSEAT